MKDIVMRNPEQIGRAIRLRRMEKCLSQSEFATSLGVGRKWVIGIEAGNPKAELGLVLKALDALGLQASLVQEHNAPFGARQPEPSRIDEVFQRLRRSGA